VRCRKKSLDRAITRPSILHHDIAFRLLILSTSIQSKWAASFAAWGIKPGWTRTRPPWTRAFSPSRKWCSSFAMLCSFANLTSALMKRTKSALVSDNARFIESCLPFLSRFLIYSILWSLLATRCTISFVRSVDASEMT